MSLVNNMLRDLDKRRKESEATNSRVKLMPASDFPTEGRNRMLLYAVAGLAVTAVALLVVWMQLDSADAPRQLNIQPAIVSAPAGSEESATEPEPERAAEEIVQTEPAAAITGTEPASDVAATTEPETADRAATELVAAVAAIAPIEPPSGPLHSGAAEQGGDTNEGAGAVQTNVSEEVGESAPSPADSLPGVVDQPDRESVKNVAEMSADMRDTLAVQEALRLIANNEPGLAYGQLEKQIIGNRYAHQSRETYAKLLLNDGNLLAANELVESGLALAPNHAGYKKVKARVLIAQGNIGEAAELLSSRSPSIESDIEYHEILATAQLASRDYEGALMSYTSLVRQDQSQGKWWYGFAASQDSLNNAGAARQAYNRALQQGDLSPNLRRRSRERLDALSQ